MKHKAIIRLAVPDISLQVSEYIKSGDADAFVLKTGLVVNNESSYFLNKLQQLIVGKRNHNYMYDGSSLCKMLRKHGFIDPIVLPAGKTTISNIGNLNLYERQAESVYVEAISP